MLNGVSDSTRWVFKKHNITTAMRLHITVMRMVVQPKYKFPMDESPNMIYELPCGDNTNPT